MSQSPVKIDEINDMEDAQRLHDLVSQRLADYIAAHEQKHASLDAARDKAEKEVNRRLEDMNELRAQINRERGAYVSQEAHAVRGESIDQRITILIETFDKRLTLLERQSSEEKGALDRERLATQSAAQSAAWRSGVIMAIVAIIVSVAIAFLKG